jgi:hypothetical protein
VQALRTIYRYWTALLFLAVIVQIGAAAYGGFYSVQKLEDQSGSDESKSITEKVFDHGWGFHTAFGYIIFLAALILLVLALAARLGKRRVLFALVVPVAVVVQIVLAWVSGSVAAIGFLHGINALVVFGLTGSLAGQAWWGTRRPAATSAPTTPAA